MKRSFAALALLACGGAAAADSEIVGITLRHLPEQRGWLAQYHLEKPVDQLRFDGYGARRHSSWIVETPGLRLAERDGAEFLESAAGKSFLEARLRFPGDDTKLRKDYQLTQGFTDGSEWIYTGHLYGKPLRRGIQERKARFRVRLVPLPSERIMVGGRRSAGPVTWTDRSVEQQGTFAYFGLIAPVETADLLAIVDPALPDHLLQTFRRELPRLFAYYGDRTGFRLTQRPQILISFRTQRPGADYAGDALPGSLDFNFVGSDWKRDDPALRAEAFHFIAHESAHLWNGQMFHSLEQDKAPWMHEGGADAFAWVAARDLGLLNDAALATRIQKALNRCLQRSGKAEDSLQSLFLQRNYDLGYTCGSVMNVLVDAELRDKGGLLAFWRALFSVAHQAKDRYSVEDFFATLEQQAGDAKLSDLLRKLWSGPLADGSAALRSALDREGVEVSAGAPPPAESLDYAIKAMAALMQQDCDGFVNMWSNPDRIRVGGGPHCHVLKDRDVTITALAGEQIENNGFAIYEAVARRCVQGKDVDATVSDNGEPISLHCSRALPELPDHLSLKRWPSPKTKGPAL